MPKVALLISAVRMAKSRPSLTPRFFPFVGEFDPANDT